MVDQSNVITIVNFIISNQGEQILTVDDDLKNSKTVIPPNTTHAFDSTGIYLGYIDDELAFELVFRGGCLAVNRGRAFKNGGQILITTTLA